MRHVNNNRISATVTPAMVAEAIAAMNTIAGIFPFLVTLTEEERKGLVRIGKVNKAYMEDAYWTANRRPDLMPSFFSLQEMGKDIEGFNALKEVADRIQELSDKVRDTRMLMGAEGYMAALSIYKSLDIAHRNGAVGAERARLALSGRFRIQNRNKTGEDGDSGPNG